MSNKKPNNIRNAGRKLIPDSVRINRLIPRENLQEVDASKNDAVFVD